jgi:hypothetical protein
MCPNEKDIEWIEDDNGCHVCISHKPADNHGTRMYPNKWIGERKCHIPMHRYVWEGKFGKLKKGLVVRHVCDNPRCINVAHLIIGTQTDNVADRERRGRTSFGERHATAKLSKKEVLKIFVLLEKGDSYKLRGNIAKEYGVSLAAITDIRLGRTWARTTMGLERCPKRSGRT